MLIEWYNGRKFQTKQPWNTEGKVETMRNLGHYLCVLPVKGNLLRAAALSVDNKSALLLAPIWALPRSLAAAYIARSPLTRRPPGHHGFQRYSSSSYRLHATAQCQSFDPG
jgi:hypothetical protein